MNKHLKCVIKLLFSPIVVVIAILLVIIHILAVVPAALVTLSGCINYNPLESDPWGATFCEWYHHL